jgi:hypothetical protein
MINVSEVILSPEFVQTYEVHRSSGSFVGGRWVENTPEVISVSGVVTVMSSRELNQVPEGDKITGAMNFFSTVPLYLTREEGVDSGTSDKIKWRGNYYKLFQVAEEADYGYYKASGARILGN